MAVAAGLPAASAVPFGTLGFAVLSLVGLLVLLWVLGRRRSGPWQEWDHLLGGDGSRRYRSLEDQFGWDREVIDQAYADAVAARQRSLDDVRRLLDLGYRFLEEVSGERVRLLKQMASYTRMIGLFVSPPPLRPGRFQLGKLEGLAALGYIAHQFLVGAGERFQLRLYLIRAGFRLVLRLVARSRLQLAVPQPEELWARLNPTREDFHTLSNETLQSVRVFLFPWRRPRSVGSW
jgi:hypothetical protein